ncbi:hypothetical protein CEP51_005609 [Fusarium floridanum]|uniref:Uncharacterized protein n=1 Tax=Fusarium floridanum TaxID=1325733 RepID=A0A428RW28_9HYPO|nr:hypothetical protein CEP51_005609 [Fusarium floridanum]
MRTVAPPEQSISPWAPDLYVKMVLISTDETQAARRYISDWKGIKKFRGVTHYSLLWPDEEIDDLSVETQQLHKELYPEMFRLRETIFAGFRYGWSEKNTFDDTPDHRRATYEKAWAEGGFRFWVSIYKDNLFDGKTNEESYKFWAEKTRARVQDPKERDLLATLQMPHCFGIKRPCLEHDYFEQCNRSNVDIIDIKTNPVKEFTKTGLVLKDGTHHDDLDVGAIATGFDVVTGAEIPPVSSRRGFCDAHMHNWSECIDHIAEHFRKGKMMGYWKGEHEFESEKADLVMDAIPPYLIKDELETVTPFPATDRTMRTTTQHIGELQISSDRSMREWDMI